MAGNIVIDEDLRHSATLEIEARRPKDEDGQIIIKANTKESNIKQARIGHERQVHRNEIISLSLLVAVRTGDTAKVGATLDLHPEAERWRDPSSGENLLHVAVKWGHLNVVKELVKRMTGEDLEIETGDGLTALLIAIEVGSQPIVEFLVGQNRKLASIIHKDHSLPVVYALLFCGQTQMVHFLYSATPPEDLTALDQGKHGSILLSQCILANHLDIALHLMGRAPLLALTEGSATGKSPVYELAAAGKVYPSGWLWEKWIYHCIRIPDTATNHVSLNIQNPEDSQVNCTGIIPRYGRALFNLAQGMVSYVLELLGINKLYETKLGNFQIDELMRGMCKVVETTSDKKQIAKAGVREAIIEAVYHGNIEFIKSMSKANPEFLWDNAIARRVFEVAIALRDAKIFSLIYGLPNKVPIASSVDENKCNLLHKAALLAHPTARNRSRGSALDMQTEFHWFKEVETIVPVAAREKPNKEAQKPWKIFTESHRVMVIEGRSWTKQISKCCMYVAAVIATIASTLAFSFVTGNNQQTGFPTLSNTSFFNAFKVSAIVALFSSFSVMIFFGLLTSHYAEEDFEKSLPTKLILGLFSLFSAIATVILTFCVGFYISYPELGTVIALFCMACTLIGVLGGLQFPFLLDIVMSTYGPSIFDRKVKSWI